MPSAGAQRAGQERLPTLLRKLPRPLSPRAQQEPKWVSLEASKGLVCVLPETQKRVNYKAELAGQRTKDKKL